MKGGRACTIIRGEMRGRAVPGQLTVLACTVCLALSLPSAGSAAGSPKGDGGSSSDGRASYTAPSGGSSPAAQPAGADQSAQTSGAATRSRDQQPVTASTDGGESTETAKLLVFLLVLFIVMIAVPVQISKAVASRRLARAEAASTAGQRPADPSDAA